METSGEVGLCLSPWGKELLEEGARQKVEVGSFKRSQSPTTSSLISHFLSFAFSSCTATSRLVTASSRPWPRHTNSIGLANCPVFCSKRSGNAARSASACLPLTWPPAAFFSITLSRSDLPSIGFLLVDEMPVAQGAKMQIIKDSSPRIDPIESPAGFNGKLMVITFSIQT
jgi:hypothetical protein